MPNAHTHLAAVSDLLRAEVLTGAFPWLGGSSSNEAQAAFLLGAISPDVRVVSGHPREATHFFSIPPEHDRPAHEVMMSTYPDLRDAGALQPSHAAFVAGYITHLIMDQVWLEVVVMPGLFIDGQVWGIRHPNWRLYSILMTWLEYRSARQLQPAMTDCLARALPDRWLPFVEDRHLAHWRDHVVEMIRTDGARRTSEIFAQTNHLSAAELEAIVLSDDRMADEAYAFVSPERLAQFDSDTAQRSLDAVMQYLQT